MKIVVIGPQFPDSFARNVVVTLSAMGHEVVSLAGNMTRHNQARLARAFWTYLPKAFPVIEARSYRAMIAEAGRSKFDLVLVTIGTLPPEVVDELRVRCHVPVVCWYTDPIANWYRQYLLAANWDTIFLKEPRAVHILRQHLGRRAFFLPEAMNPIWHRTMEPTAEDHQRFDCDLLAQGTLHYYRARMLEPLVNYDLKVWGSNNPAWIHSNIKSRYMGRFLGEEEKARAFSCAKIAVNIVSHLEVEGVNCSLFEYAGIGLFQIAANKATLGDLFEPESEIATYASRHELLEKVDFYLARPQLRREMAARAQARCLRDHTYETRLKTLLEVSGTC